MNEILLSHEVIVYLLSEAILYLLLLLAFATTVGLLRKWDFQHFTTAQFKRENRAYLVMTIIFFVTLLKLLLLPYFVYTVDALSNLVPGAMCAAGVVKANGYGGVLLVLKVVILLLSGVWMSINHLDLQQKNYPYFYVKMGLFVVIFLLLSGEFLLDILYFTHIETTKTVSCCSVIYGQTGGTNGLPLGLDLKRLLTLFYLLYGLILLTLLTEMFAVALVSLLLFAPVAYYSVVYFFGTYIYELPTHKCPFCMMQYHYHYVGYLVWGLLLFGLFFGVDFLVMWRFFRAKRTKLKYFALLLLTLFVLLCSGYVLYYYLQNGVLL